MTLGSELLVDLIGAGIVTDSPGGTQLFGQIVAGHTDENVQETVGGFINDQLGNIGSHGNHHLDVERDLSDFRHVGGRDAVETTNENVIDVDIGQAGLGFVSGDVGGVITVELQ